MASPIVAFSFRRVSFKAAIHEGLPSPVSTKRRCRPVPTIYVLVPDRMSNQKSPHKAWKVLPCNVNCDTVLDGVLNEGKSEENERNMGGK
jgi:hypothetical protein